MQLEFLVQKQEDNLFLRDFLRRRGMSVTLLRSIKQNEGFFCEQEPIRANERVYAGKTIICPMPPELSTSVEPQEIPLNVMWENAHTMVLNKPAGQTIHPTCGYISGTLANAFCGEMQRRGTAAVFRPVNRIDKNTSGLVLCAMNAYAAPLLAKSVQKWYDAIVQGELPLGKGMFNAPIAQEEGSFIRRCVAQRGKPSCTEYTVLAAAQGFSYVRCVPVTGRTHQIRVHFSYAGHPLAGDDLYGGDRTYIARHALHCAGIRFLNITNAKLQTVSCALPDDMRKLLEHMGREATELEL